mmetsp:Transcript_17462/g.33186  ORF Transcript_17462/g.33186 Transcript_17462/m.33186 type:complete len:234 (+) Transcript_17462:25-726(+)
MQMASVSLLALALTVLCLVSLANAWKTGKGPLARKEFLQKSVASIGAFSTVFATTNVQKASAELRVTELTQASSSALPIFGRPKPSRSLEDCALSIAYVQLACDQLIESINQGEYDSLARQLKMVLTNYRVEDSIRQAALNLPAGPKEVAVKTAGRDAVEFLNQINEYFPDDVDPITMKKLPPSAAFTPKRLQFIVKALEAAKSKFGVVLAELPEEMVSDIQKKITSEMSDEA